MSEKSLGLTRRAVLAAAPLLAAPFIPGSPLAAPAGAAVPEPIPQKEPEAHFAPLPNFKFNLYGSKQTWYGPGGAATEQNVSNFPLSKSIAAVSMKLQPGGLRELHWHAIAAEWAYILKGRLRTTIVSPNGETQENFFEPGDTWYFPKGYGHALQGIGPGETHFILGFDDGNFSEFGTFSITDWLANTPRNIVARNLRLPESAVANLPRGQVYITQGPVPPSTPQKPLNPVIETSQKNHRFSLGDVAPKEFAGGEERVVSSEQFPIQHTLTSARLNMKPGALREMH